MIVKAESALLQPEDRDYKLHNKMRNEHLEILGNGFCYCIRAGIMTYALIKYDKDKASNKTRLDRML